MTCSVGKIRGFLLVNPKPARLRVTCDDNVEEVKLGKSYAKTAETIHALDPDLIECLDPQGVVLRALAPDSVEARRSDAAAIPAGLENDPNALMMTHFANLVHRAYEHSTELAFTKMVEVFDIMGARSESIETRLERTEARNRALLQQQVEDAFDRAEEVAAEAAEGKGDLGEQLLGSFMGGKMHANGANGAAKAKG